mmetsp:Transcript_128484/g.256669  ORF Transcript_128484/g.256669 Transcript_128484/m.256669 type:complete len:228 (+) Transcript_128484:163-846(+)
MWVQRRRRNEFGNQRRRDYVQASAHAEATEALQSYVAASSNSASGHGGNHYSGNYAVSGFGASGHSSGHGTGSHGGNGHSANHTARGRATRGRANRGQAARGRAARGHAGVQRTNAGPPCSAVPLPRFVGPATAAFFSRQRAHAPPNQRGANSGLGVFMPLATGAPLATPQFTHASAPRSRLILLEAVRRAEAADTADAAGNEVLGMLMAAIGWHKMPPQPQAACAA